MTRDETRATQSPPGGAGLRLRAAGGVLVLAGVLALRSFVALPVQISSASMAPSFAAGDVVLISRNAPSVSEVERWDVVVFDDPRRRARTIKRVVGLPGEDVVILDGVLHVDGRAMAESWVEPAPLHGYYSRTMRVPPAHVLVLGDNRTNSVDSRDYGAVPVEDLDGRVLLRLWPGPALDGASG